MNAGVVALGLYLALIVWIADRARRARTGDGVVDHFLASRSLGPWVLFLTLYATAYSGNSLLGYPGEAYRRGFSWIMATGFMMAIIVVFHAIVPKLRPIAVRHAFVHPGDWLRHRFAGEPGARALQVAVAIVMLFASANFLTAQLMALGHLVARITGDLLPYGPAVVFFALVIFAYEAIGGMRAVAWTDAGQGAVMVVALTILAAWVLAESGGVSGLTAAIRDVRPESTAVPDAREIRNWISTTVLLGLASVVYPQALQRVYAARSSGALRRALAAMSFMPLGTTFVVTLIGWAAIPRFSGLGRIEADTILPRILDDMAVSGLLGTGLAVAVSIAALSAIMSTADSVLLSMSSIVVGDLPRERRADVSPRALRYVAAAAMGACALVALTPRFTLWRLIELKMELLIQCVPAYVGALHTNRLRAGPLAAGLLVGCLVAVVGTAWGFGRPAGVHIGVWGLAVNVLVSGALSLVSKERED